MALLLILRSFFVVWAVVWVVAVASTESDPASRRTPPPSESVEEDLDDAMFGQSDLARPTGRPQGAGKKSEERAGVPSRGLVLCRSVEGKDGWCW